MARSISVAPNCIPIVKAALGRNGFPSQKALAIELGLSRSTITSFLNGKPVDYVNFVEISEKLGLNWQAIAYVDPPIEIQSSFNPLQAQSSPSNSSSQNFGEAPKLDKNFGVGNQAPVEKLEQTIANRPAHERSYRERIKNRYAEDALYYIPLSAETLEVASTPVKAPRSAHRRRQRATAEYHEWIQVGPMIRRVKLETLRAGVDKYSCIILLGDPGSGKTTALENLAYQFADAPDWLPLPLSLSEFRPGLTVEAFIVQAWAGSLEANHWGAPEMAANLEGFLEEGKLFVLFDALNEMPREGFQERTHALRQFIDRWSAKGNRFLVTCRVLDYGEELSGLQRVEVQPLNDDQIKAFVQKELPENWETLWQTLAQSDGPLAMARNPYMLTLMIDIFDEDGQLGPNRAQLMNRFTQILMEWAKKKCPKDKWIEVDVQRVALSVLAFEMQDRAGSGSKVKRSLVETVMPQQVQTHPNWPPRPAPPEQILTLAASAKIVEMPVDRSSVRFYHQLLQEYFAAHQMLGQDPSSLTDYWRWPWLKTEMPIWVRSPNDKFGPLPPPPPTGWEETTILAAGLAAENDTQLIRALIQVNPVLAGRCLHEGQVRVDRTTRQTAIAALLDTIAQPDVALRVRIAAGEVLGYLGDPRLGEFVTIPTGEFWMGSETEAAVDFEKPAHRVHLVEFSIGKYPLTNAEYARFVEDGGYSERRYWTEAGWAWRHGDFGEKPDDYGEQFWRWILGRKHFDRPDSWYDLRWNKPNYPVVGITWYEALAYTRWLTEVWRSEARIEKNQVVRLPTEAEWEKAARGGLEIPQKEMHSLDKNPLPQREYPWGNEFDAARLNAKAGDEPVGSTTVVGIFPQGSSPYGCMDMSGNVWEWCSSLVQDYPYNTSDGRENLEVKGYRVVRGQSWFEPNDGRARCSYRGKAHPATFSGGLFGMRLMVGLPLLAQLLES